VLQAATQVLAAVALPSLDVLTASGRDLVAAADAWRRHETCPDPGTARVPERAGVTAALGLLVSAVGDGYRVTGQLPGVSL